MDPAKPRCAAVILTGVLLDQLNSTQLDAVTHTEGPLLILAGAGSGKTRVLTHRISSLLAQGCSAPTRYSPSPFTNKAAAELKDQGGACSSGRTRARCGSRPSRVLRSASCGSTPRSSDTRRELHDLRLRRPGQVVRRCIIELGRTQKGSTPGLSHAQISTAKNLLLACERPTSADRGFMAEKRR
jgi:DNA helicase-2/ATP-dependent DNA helicase PcrA